MLIIFFAILLLSVVIYTQKSNSILNNHYMNNSLLIIIVILFSIEIYYLKPDAIPDYLTYERWFYTSKYLNISQLNLIEIRDSLFFLFLWAFSKLSSNFNLFLVLVWIIISLILSKTLKKLFEKSEIFLVFISYTNYFVFFNYVLNTMRQGLSISVMMLLISYLICKGKNKLIILLLSISAPLLHISSLIPIIILLAYFYFTPKLKVVFIFWIFSSFLALTNLNSKIFSSFNFDLLNVYSSVTSIQRYGEVNRIDFIAFSLIIGFFFYFISIKTHHQNKIVLHLTSSYLLLNSYYLLLGFIAYSDRIAAFSWFIVPIIIWKIVLSKNNPLFNSFVLLAFIALGIASKSYSIFY